MEELEITRLFKIRRTVLQMLRDRGYPVDDAEIEMTRLQFIERFVGDGQIRRENLTVESSKGDGAVNKICVFFVDGLKLGIAVVKMYAARLKENDASNGILVVQKLPSSHARKALGELNNSFSIQIFEEEELVSNITEHILVPKHILLTFEEKKKLLKDYKIKETQLPLILFTDPVVKYLGMKRGQIVKIIRKSDTADTYVTYRYCV